MNLWKIQFYNSVIVANYKKRKKYIKINQKL